MRPGALGVSNRHGWALDGPEHLFVVWRMPVEHLDPHELERLRGSIVMLQPGPPAGLKREEAMRLLAETQRLQRRLADVMARLRAIVEEIGA